jgi:hypothetical protein
MKILLSVTCLFFVSRLVFCQVAINTDGSAVSDPSALLEIKKATFAKVKIRSLHYNDTAQIELSNRTTSNSGTDFRITAKREQGFFFSSVSDLAQNTNDSLFTIRTNGRVGIGIKNPSYKLDVNGDINLNSYLRVNGSAGANGQVLTSTGTGAPAWKTGAYGDNIRFGLRFNGTSSPVLISNLYYNLSPSDVGITPGTTSISINQSGLYHFEGEYSGTVQGTGFSGAPEFSLRLSITGSSTYGLNLCTWKQLVYRTAVINNWYLQDNFSIDMYVTAPAQLLVYRTFLASTTPTYTDASVTMYGYLISQ